VALTPLTGAATLTVKISDFNTLITQINADLATLEAKLTSFATKAEVEELRKFDLALEQRLLERITTLEEVPLPALGHDALDGRIAALENAAARTPAEASTPAYEPLPRPADLDPATPELVYDKATIYLGDMELHAQRIGARRWRLMAQLNYITVNQIQWTYDETVEGTPDEVYAHALRRLEELAELKPRHDAVHDRVKAMSEGAE
jgi:hypothetical protein